MKNYNFVIILIAIGISSCLNAQQPDNKKPMYGEVSKSECYKEIDAECPDAYFAFSALMKVQGYAKEAKRFDKIGHEKDVTKERAKACYEQMKFCKEQWKRKEQWENEQKKHRNKHNGF